MEDVPDEIRRLVAKRLGVAEDRIKPETAFYDLGDDSLALVELTLIFEEAFDIEIPDAEADRIRTVRDATICIEKYFRMRRPG